LDVACFNLDGVSADPKNPKLIAETEAALKRLVPESIMRDMARLRELEVKMNQANYMGLEFIEKSPLIAAIVLSPLRLANFIRKKL
jgi:hypothetical protein